MKTYKTIEEVKKDIVDGELNIKDDITIEFSEFDIEANITCFNIKADNIIALGISANDITASDITANDIKANDITANNIKAYDIKADNISYYACCISYKNIECNSINGRRHNSFHKCLDGKLTLIEKKHTITIDGKNIELSEESFNNLKKSLK